MEGFFLHPGSCRAETLRGASPPSAAPGPFPEGPAVLPWGAKGTEETLWPYAEGKSFSNKGHKRKFK